MHEHGLRWETRDSAGVRGVDLEGEVVKERMRLTSDDRMGEWREGEVEYKRYSAFRDKVEFGVERYSMRV